MNLVFALLIFAATVSTFLAALAWTRRPAVSATLFALMMTATAIWSGGVIFGLAAPDLATKPIWAKFVFLGIASAPVALFAFILEYTGQQEWITPRNAILIAIEPIFTLILA